MRSHYKRTMERITLPSDTLEKIQAKASAPQTRKFSPKAAAVAAAACLAAILLPVGAASAYGYFFHKIPDEVAHSLQPINLSHTSQDIIMTVQYASVEQGTLAVYLTLEDISGEDRLAQGVDFYHSYRVWKPDDAEETFYKYRSLGYDEDSHTYGFLVEITPSNESGNALYLQDQVYTLSVGQLLLAQAESEPTLSPDWSTLPAEPDAELRSCNEWGYIDSYRREVRTSDNTAEVLLPGSWELPAADGFTITAAGFLDNGLHIQLRYNNRNAPHDYGDLTLTTSDGNIIGNVLGCEMRDRFCWVGFRDQHNYRYTEYIFDVSPEELEGASLSGRFITGGYLLDGDWEVTFSFEQNETP